MKRSYPKILRNRKQRIQRRLDPERGWSDQVEPIMKASNIHYEMAEKARAVSCGGMGAIHLMINKLGLRQENASGGLHACMKAPDSSRKISLAGSKPSWRRRHARRARAMSCSLARNVFFYTSAPFSPAHNGWRAASIPALRPRAVLSSSGQASCQAGCASDADGDRHDHWFASRAMVVRADLAALCSRLQLKPTGLFAMASPYFTKQQTNETGYAGWRQTASVPNVVDRTSPGRRYSPA